MKGWVYVITNRAMPGLVKIGFSTKDPELRAEELNHTGAPHPYQVEYDILIDEPRNFEQAAHAKLRECKEGKEWFRCTSERAIVAIKEVVGAAECVENFRKIDREKAALLAQALKSEEQAKRVRHETIERRKREILDRYRFALEAELPDRNFWADFTLVLLSSFFVVAIVFQDVNDTVLIVLPFVCSFVITPIVRGHFREKAKNSPRYKELVQKQEAELSRLEISQPTFSVNNSAPLPTSTRQSPAISAGILQRSPRSDSIMVSCNFCGESSEHPDVHMISCPRCKRTIFTR